MNGTSTGAGTLLHFLLPHWEETGVDADEADNNAPGSGSVHAFRDDGAGNWNQHAYLKASNTDAGESFGNAPSLSEDGNTLAVAARREDSTATGVGGNQEDESQTLGGAAYWY